MTTRCSWARSEQMVEYHDREWGVPVRDDARLFEMLTLEGAQAGLSWEIILRKREGYRTLFAGFDPARVARFSEKKIERLVGDARIVRHRGKIESVVDNARAILAVQKEHGAFSSYVWGFLGGERMIHRHRKLEHLPARTTESAALSKDLRKRGFRFVGPTTVYAFMQAAGMVNDHLVSCFRHAELS